MFDAARKDGIYPVVWEGYRTYEEQQKILDDKIKAYINEGYSQSRAIFPQPFRVVNTSVLVLSCHSPANKEDKTIPRNKAITTPRSATILPRSVDQPSTHS
jgi:hypothetical protein